MWNWKISKNNFSIYQWSRNANKCFNYFILTICHNHVSGNSVLIFVVVFCSRRDDFFFWLFCRSAFIGVRSSHALFSHLHAYNLRWDFRIRLMNLAICNFNDNPTWSGRNRGNHNEYYNELEGEKITNQLRNCQNQTFIINKHSLQK